MKAIAIDSFGGDHKLKLVELPSPEPKEGEVLVSVKSAGVAIWDEMYIRGEIPPDNPKFPLVPGWEGAGVISALGKGVTQFGVGDEVFFFDYPEGDFQGAWAEETVVSASCVARKPKALSMEEAGGLPIVSLTAYQVLREGFEIKPGQVLLICNGAGGVGTLTIQLAHLMGVRTIALASPPNHNLLKKLGADRVFDYHKDFVEELKKVVPEGVDCVFDNIGARDTVAKALPCLKFGGTFLSIVQKFEDLQAKHVENKYFEVHPSGEQLAEISQLVDQGKLRVVIDQVYPFEKYRDALKKVESGHAHGKVVLKVA